MRMLFLISFVKLLCREDFCWDNKSEIESRGSVLTFVFNFSHLKDGFGFVGLVFVFTIQCFLFPTEAVLLNAMMHFTELQWTELKWNDLEWGSVKGSSSLDVLPRSLLSTGRLLPPVVWWCEQDFDISAFLSSGIDEWQVPLRGCLLSLLHCETRIYWFPSELCTLWLPFRHFFNKAFTALSFQA